MVSPEYIIYPVILVLSITLAILAIMAFRRNQQVKMLVLAVFFTIFLMKGLLVSLDIFYDYFSLYWLFTLGGFMDAFALLLLYLATLKV